MSWIQILKEDDEDSFLESSGWASFQSMKFCQLFFSDLFSATCPIRPTHVHQELIVSQLVFVFHQAVLKHLVRDSLYFFASLRIRKKRVDLNVTHRKSELFLQNLNSRVEHFRNPRCHDKTTCRSSLMPLSELAASWRLIQAWKLGYYILQILIFVTIN